MLFLILSALLAACRSAADPAMTATPAGAGPTAALTVEPATMTAGPTTPPATSLPPTGALPTPAATEPTPTGAPPDPPDQAAIFRNLTFAASGDGLSQPFFEQRIEEVFALWSYEQMSAGDVVRRVWTRDGTEWLVREERWDLTQYGPAGVVRDISVFDFEGAGLEPAFYKLTLAINDSVEAQGTFVIRPADLRATSGDRTAWVEQEGLLMLAESEGQARELLRTQAIEELHWLPDGRRLLYVDRQEPVDPSGPPWPTYTLWLVDVETAAQQPLSEPGQRVRRIAVSPDGRYISALAGTDFGDACGMDRSLLFLDLNAPGAWVNQRDFAAVFNEAPYGFFPADAGQWLSDHEFAINLTAFCMSAELGTPAEDLSLLSRYRFDLETRTATRAGQ